MTKKQTTQYLLLLAWFAFVLFIFVKTLMLINNQTAIMKIINGRENRTLYRNKSEDHKWYIVHLQWLFLRRALDDANQTDHF